MLLRTAQKYGVRVQSLQHVLEGYKVAAEIAAHGASASTFSDWWAYKIEAYDAIPYNAALLTEAGASVCIKSDDAELMRHLNLEAAKMVKYGGVTESQALAMITINPARELGLDGSPGLDRGGQGRRYRAVQRPSVRRLLAVRAGPDRWRGLLPAARARRQVRRPARASTPRCPAAPSRCGTARSRSPRSPRASSPWSGPTSTRSPARRSRAEPWSSPTARSRRSGRPARRFPPRPRRSSMSGLDIWPGMVDAGSTIGLFEVGSLTETQDFADAAQFQPELRTSTALHPDSEHIPGHAANGILTVVRPAHRRHDLGPGLLINLNGWVPRELVIADQVALNVTIPTLRRPRLPSADGEARTRARTRTRASAVSRRRDGLRNATEGTARGDQGAFPRWPCVMARSWRRPDPSVLRPPSIPG